MGQVQRPVDEADAWYGLAMIQRGLGHELRYAAALRKVIALNPHHSRADWIRGQIAVNPGNVEAP